jgi:hypothetical protein
MFDCDIHLWGTVSTAELEKLFRSCLYPFSYRPTTFIEAVRKNEELVFQSAEMQEVSRIQTCLMRANLGFHLNYRDPTQWKRQHVELWDPDLNEKHSYKILDGQLYIPADVLDCPKLIEKSRRGRALIDTAASKPTIVFDSAHDLIEALGEDNKTTHKGESNGQHH